METQLLPYGLPALFLISFLAATVLPLGSEWFLILLLLHGSDPFSSVAVASFGNYLGGFTTYLLGIWGAGFCQRLLRITDKQLNRAKLFYDKYGIWSLLLSWLPIIGDPLCFLAGMFKAPPIIFSILVLLGKTGRYITLALLTLKGANMM